MRLLLRRGALLVELVLTLALLGVVMAIAIPSVRTMLDRLSVRGARHDVVLGLWAARAAATRRGELARFHVDEAGAQVLVIVAADTVYRRRLSARGVAVMATRDSIAYAPTGLGYGAANTTIVLSRGRRADTVTTSRLGRVAWSGM